MPLRGHRGCAADSLLGGLEQELDRPAEFVGVLGDPARQREPDRRVPVVPAGVHQPGPFRREAQRRRRMPGIARLLHVDAVDVEAQRDDRAGPAGPPDADAAGQPVHLGEQRLVDAAAFRKVEARGDDRRVAAQRVVARDRLRPGQHREAVAAQQADHPRGGRELGPADLRHPVQLAPQRDELLGVGKRVHHVTP